MKKYILLLLLACMLMPSGVSAQSSMSDNQVLEFVMKEHKRGTSQAQIVTKLMQRGVNINQIRRVKAMAENMQKGGNTQLATTKTATDDRSRRNNAQEENLSDEAVAKQSRQIYKDEQTKASRYSSQRISKQDESANTYDDFDEDYLAMQDEMDDWMPADTAAMYKRLVEDMKKKKKKVYGHDFFNRKDLSFEPVMNIATPQNYHLGPGDAVYIDIYGASQKSIQATVSPDGYVTIEGFGPVQVSGLTVAQANARIKSQLGQRYSSSQIRLSVGQTRTIMVNVMGEVKKPGTYTLSAFATVFHALHMAGGVTDLSQDDSHPSPGIKMPA